MLDNIRTRLSRRAGLALLAAIGTSVLFAATPESAEAPELLFVQSANEIAATGDQLRLKGIGPTVFFSDRPKRMVGHLNLDDWQKLWTQGRDSFTNAHPLMIKETTALCRT